MLHSEEGRVNFKSDWMVVYKLATKIAMLSIALRTGNEWDFLWITCVFIKMFLLYRRKMYFCFIRQRRFGEML